MMVNAPGTATNQGRAQVGKITFVSGPLLFLASMVIMPFHGDHDRHHLSLNAQKYSIQLFKSQKPGSQAMSLKIYL